MADYTIKEKNRNFQLVCIYLKRLCTHLHTIIYVNTYIGTITKNKYTILVLPNCKSSFRSQALNLYMFTDFYAVLMNTLLFYSLEKMQIFTKE